MGRTKDLFIAISEDEYMDIPNEIRERHLTSKVVKVEDKDFDELMEDDTFNNLYKEHKSIGKQLDERKYTLRENKRKNL